MNKSEPLDNRIYFRIRVNSDTWDQQGCMQPDHAPFRKGDFSFQHLGQIQSALILQRDMITQNNDISVQLPR